MGPRSDAVGFTRRGSRVRTGFEESPGPVRRSGLHGADAIPAHLTVPRSLLACGEQKVQSAARATTPWSIRRPGHSRRSRAACPSSTSLSILRGSGPGGAGGVPGAKRLSRGRPADRPLTLLLAFARRTPTRTTNTRALCGFRRRRREGRSVNDRQAIALRNYAHRSQVVGWNYRGVLPPHDAWGLAPRRRQPVVWAAAPRLIKRPSPSAKGHTSAIYPCSPKIAIR